MRRSVRVTFRLSLIPAMLAAAFALPSIPAPAHETFLIPQDEGYGVAECLNTGSACARTVADAWCTAMGRGPSLSFGRIENETAVIETAVAKTKDTGFRVTCG
jgi:hypothetical protein